MKPQFSWQAHLERGEIQEAVDQIGELAVAGDEVFAAALPALSAALADPEFPLAEELLRALAERRCCVPEVVAVARAHLGHDDVPTQIAAAVLLAVCGDDQGTIAVIDRLRRADEDSTATESVLMAIRRVRLTMPEVLAAVEDCFTGGNDDAAWFAFEALVDLKPTEDLARLLRGMLTSTVVAHRLRACRRFSELGASAAPYLSELMALRNDADVDCRLAAIIALDQLTPRLNLDVRQIFNPWAHDNDERVRLRAQLALAYYGEPEDVDEGAVAAALDDDDPDIRRRSAVVLGRRRSGEPAVRKLLWSRLKRGETDDVETAIYEALACSPAESVSECIELLRGRDYALHGHAIALLGRAENPPGAQSALVEECLSRNAKHYARLEQLDDPPSSSVLVIAQEMKMYLAKHAPAGSRRLKLLLEADLDGQSELVQAECLAGLKRLGLADVEQLNQLLDLTGPEVDSAAARVARAALGLNDG